MPLDDRPAAAYGADAWTLILATSSGRSWNTAIRSRRSSIANTGWNAPSSMFFRRRCTSGSPMTGCRHHGPRTIWRRRPGHGRDAPVSRRIVEQRHSPAQCGRRGRHEPRLHRQIRLRTAEGTLSAQRLQRQDPLLLCDHRARRRQQHHPHRRACDWLAAQLLGSLAMAVIKSEISAASEEYRRNSVAYAGRIADLHARRAAAVIGGPERARRLHKERKQLLPRERIAALLDAGSP